MVGQESGGTPAKKPTEVTASSPELLDPFLNLRCDGSLCHANNWGASPKLKQLQRWSWDFAGRMVEGAILLKRRIGNQFRTSMEHCGMPR